MAPIVRVTNLDKYFGRLHVLKSVSASIAPREVVCLIGRSGSGKSTQMEMLRNHYIKEGYTPVTLHEPTPWYRQMRSALDVNKSDRPTQLLLLLLDRYIHVRKVVIQEALALGNPVISDRSYLSSMVYQAGEGWQSAPNIAYLHMILPQPTHIFLLDTTAQEAIRRIEVRAMSQEIPLGEHESLDQLTFHRQQFLSLVDFFPHMHIINTQIYEPEAVHEQVWAILTRYVA